ncbi:hypothetical protein SAMN05661091_0639 [Paenibacillus uliginis N3/975]|uniref:Uncharacterized protein n=1 Tax=Paenibacillus uliginis N3/975 TaxID=1313296 RepID=A0A1X7GI65_9BACL|nr:hypothetical protein [Paenibacillus uliginis]SMF70197.1 hypothetical protein SAMN05661091_0639 [Paenibacillus uliginis N3/975]
MKHPLEDVSEWLQSHTNQNLLIQKREQDDLDQARLMLEFIGYQDGDNCSIDDYVACKALLLHGSGVVITDGHESPLPDSTFTLAVDGLSSVNVEDHQLTLQTGRGAYTIMPQ